MMKYLCLALTLILHHANNPAEETIEEPTITHTSTTDKTFKNRARKLYNTIGSWIGDKSAKVSEKLGINIGFGDTYRIQKMLQRPMDNTHRATFKQSINSLDAEEKTHALRVAQGTRRATDQITRQAFTMASDKEAIEQHEDGSITIHDLDSFGPKYQIKSEKMNTARIILEQYLQDPTNPLLEKNAAKIINHTGYLKRATPEQRARLIPQLLRLTKLAEHPAAFQNMLFEGNESNPVTIDLINKTLQEYFTSSNKSANESKMLLSMYNDQQKVVFLEPYTKDNAYEDKIMQLIGKNYIIIHRKICNISNPSFESPQQAIAAAQELCSKDNLTKAQKTALRNILQKMPFAHRATVLSDYDEMKKNSILENIKNQNEFILNGQIINAQNPENSLYTQEFNQFIMSTIQSLVRQPSRTNLAQEALQNFTLETYDNDPSIIANTMDDLSVQEVTELQKILPKGTYIIKEPGLPTIIIDPRKLSIKKSMRSQVETVLETMRITRDRKKCYQETEQIITKHFMSIYKIGDITRAQTVLEQLISGQTNLEPDNFQHILKALKTPTEEQKRFFDEIWQYIQTKKIQTYRVIDSLPTHTEYYDGIPRTSIIAGAKQERALLDYLTRIDLKIKELRW